MLKPSLFSQAHLR